MTVINLDSYPRLTEAGELEAQRVIDAFKKQMAKVCEDTLSNIYCDVAGYIETDSWTNFRNQFINAFRRLDEQFCGQYNLRSLAEVIAKECPEQVAKYIDQVHVAKIKELEGTIEFWKRHYGRNI